MATMQKLILIGYLGKDPESRFTPQGTQVVTVNVATTERWKDKKSGEQNERTTWHYCEAWGRTAEVMAQYLTKGDQVYIEGKLRQEEWEKDGQTQRMTKVRVDNIVFLNTKGGGASQGSNAPSGQSQQQPSQQQPSQQQQPAQQRDDFDDDIPF